MPEREAARRAFIEALLEHDADRLYEQAPCGYLSTTPDGMIVRVNETFLTWTGHERDDLVGKRTFASLLAKGSQIYHDTHYAPLLAMQDSVREIALDVVQVDGQRLPVIVNAALERTAEGLPRVVRIALFDATERRQYERELVRAKEEAERLEARALTLARTLQQTLIPPQPPEIPGLDIAAAYRPAGDGREVGGDFYDVFQRGQGDWVVVLGDVSGKGVHAAVVTSLIRYSLRAIAVRVAEPSEMLAELNQVVLAHETERFCTLLLLRLRAIDSAWHVSMSCGGHGPAALVEPGSDPVSVGEPGFLIGVSEDATFTSTSLTLLPGQMLVLYTDGTSEARRDGEFFGQARLSASMKAHAQDAQTLVSGVLRDVLDFQRNNPRDDIAVVAVRDPGIER